MAPSIKIDDLRDAFNMSANYEPPQFYTDHKNKLKEESKRRESSQANSGIQTPQLNQNDPANIYSSLNSSQHM